MEFLNIIDSRYFGIKLIDLADFGELAVRYLFNVLVVFLIVKFSYVPFRRSKDYFFTFFVLNTLIFFVCYLFSSVKLSIGFAFGLFAIFSILRYRTRTVPIKEMTFLFTIIAVAVINALSTKKVSYTELIFTNLVIILITYVLSKIWLRNEEISKIIIYEKIDLIIPEKTNELMDDLKERTGINIERFEIERIDFLRDIARIRIYYHETN